MYNDVMTRLGVPFDVSSWKVKVPLKIKIYLWYLIQLVHLLKITWPKGSGNEVLNVASAMRMR
jgi:hypothetical protein